MKSFITIALTALLPAVFTLTGVSVLAQAGKKTTEKDIRWYVTHAPFAMQVPAEPEFPARSFNLMDYGAAGDGQTLNTAAFASAMQACSAAGGGRLIVPPGLWLTGPIALQSNVDLHLEKGALVIFTRDRTLFPLVHAPSGRQRLAAGDAGKGNAVSVSSPISGYDLQNVAITGEGIFDGGGDAWRPVKKMKTTAAQWKELLASGGALSRDGEIWWPSAEARDGEEWLKAFRKKNAAGDAPPEDYLPARDFLRPIMLALVRCRKVLVEGVTIRNSPNFVFCPTGCTDLTMDHVTIFNEWWAQNGDGIDISACRNVVLYKCTVSAGDDGICMKSSGGRPGGAGAASGAGMGMSAGQGSGSGEGSREAALENVVIAGCTVYHAHGGFVIGSNTDGGMQNIAVSDCDFIGTDVGLRFKSNMGRGGLVHDIYIHDIFMRDIVNEAVLFDTYYENVTAGSVKDPNKPLPADKTPEFRDFHISRIYCSGAKTAISITGLPQMPVSGIFFDTLVISANKGLIATQAKNIDLHLVQLITQEQPVYQVDPTAEVRIRQ